MTTLDMYEIFLERYFKTKEQYERMKSNGHPDTFFTKLTMDLNEKLMKIFKPIAS